MRTQEFITELFDLGTNENQPPGTFQLEWDDQFANSHNEVRAEAIDEEGRDIDVSFVPVGFRTAIEITFTRDGSHDMTGGGDAIRIMKTVTWAIKHYLETYGKPTYLVFSSKGDSRTSSYTAMVHRLLKGYTQVPPDQFPPGLEEWKSTQGGTPFVFKRI